MQTVTNTLTNLGQITGAGKPPGAKTAMRGSGQGASRVNPHEAEMEKHRKEADVLIRELLAFYEESLALYPEFRRYFETVLTTINEVWAKFSSDYAELLSENPHTEDHVNQAFMLTHEVLTAVHSGYRNLRIMRQQAEDERAQGQWRIPPPTGPGYAAGAGKPTGSK